MKWYALYYEGKLVVNHSTPAQSPSRQILEEVIEWSVRDFHEPFKNEYRARFEIREFPVEAQ